MQHAKPSGTEKAINSVPSGSSHMEAALLDNIHIHAAHAVDPRITHSLQLLQQLRDGRRVALNFHLHTSVPFIFHPACKAKARSHPSGSGAEAHTLDVSVKTKMFSYFLHSIFLWIKQNPQRTAGFPSIYNILF